MFWLQAIKSNSENLTLKGDNEKILEVYRIKGRT